MTETQTLLAAYVKNGSETAFRELVERYLGLVYATALRIVGGDPHFAEDVAQTVFTHLARKARTLPGDVLLGGWLHRDACHVAATWMRGERRRQNRERQAMEIEAQRDHTADNLARVRPVLDAAIDQLKPEDRQAILLRFFEQQDLRAVGEALGSSENAAQKRVSRALEELRLLLQHRGVTLSVAALGSALVAEAATAVPAGLAASIATTALVGAAAGGGLTATLLKLMAMTKLQLGIVSVVIVASVAAPFVIRNEARLQLGDADSAMALQTNQLAQLTAENQRLAGLLAAASSAPEAANRPSGELLELRGEVGRLRKLARELAPDTTNKDKLTATEQLWTERVDRLKQWLEAHPAERITELDSLTDRDWRNAIYPNTLDTEYDYRRAMRIARINGEHPVQGFMFQALRQYAKEHNGQFPADLETLRSYFKSPIEDAILQRYEILPANQLVSELQTGDKWVITEKAPVNAELDIRSAIGLNSIHNADERVTNRWVLVR